MEQGSSYLSIKSWAEEDRPREKLLIKGKSSLSDAELLAILLGSGTRDLSAVDLAKQILHHANNNLHTLAKYNVNDLKQFKGIGEAKAITVVSALELGRRRKESEPVKNIRIDSSRLVYDYMKSDLTDLAHEEFWVILLKRNNEIIKKVQISRGGVSGTVVDVSIIFKHAIEALASGIVLVHNHPSGSIKPSEQDMRITKKLKEAGILMDIAVVDHLIFANDQYLSFSDESLL